MKRGIGKSFSLAFVLVGTLIGAGFATGQEIYTFFLQYPFFPEILFVLSVSVILFGSFCCYFCCKQLHIRSYEEYLCSLFGGKIGQISYLISVLFLLACFCVTVSGCGVLFRESFRMPYWLGVAAILVVTFATLLYGMQGLFVLNSILTPVMIICVLLLGTTAVFVREAEVFAALRSRDAAMPVWFALLYAGYNAFSVMPISVSSADWRPKQTALGFFLAFVFLVPVGLMILGCLQLPGFQPELYALPFMQIVASVSRHSEAIYGMVMYFAMITTAVSCFYGFITSVMGSFQVKQSVVMSGGCLTAVVAALFPFAVLVGKLYSFFGVFGMLLLGASIYYYILLQRKRRCDKIEPGGRL